MNIITNNANSMNNSMHQTSQFLYYLGDVS